VTHMRLASIHDAAKQQERECRETRVLVGSIPCALLHINMAHVLALPSSFSARSCSRGPAIKLMAPAPARGPQLWACVYPPTLPLAP
jgi:hypothetical protein